MLAESIGIRAEGRGKPFARLGAAFGSLFALAFGANYFVQLTSVRLSIEAGDTASLSQVVMANPVSAMESVDMLGWTFLLGFSCLFLSLALEDGKGSKPARIALRLTGCVCVTAGIAFALNCTAVVALCMYPLLGGGLLASSAALAVHFRSSLKRA